MSKPKILAFAGSLRKDSYNRKILKLAVESICSFDVDVTHIDLLDYQMPLLNQDDEDREGLPANAIALKKLMRESDGFLIASPEYNSSYSAVLKNTIDWVSRKEHESEPSLDVFNGKLAALISASPSWMGGMRSLNQLRTLLSNINVTVIADQFTLPSAHEAFNEKNELNDPKKMEALTQLGKNFSDFLKKYKS